VAIPNHFVSYYFPLPSLTFLASVIVNMSFLSTYINHDPQSRWQLTKKVSRQYGTLLFRIYLFPAQLLILQKKASQHASVRD